MRSTDQHAAIDPHVADADGFTELELAFFAEGDALSTRPDAPVDTFEDLS